MRKTCVICGSEFEAPPSSKKVTCSPECRSKRAALSARKGHKWSSDARARRSRDPLVQERMEKLQAVGAAAALELPEGQRGPQHRASKVWILVDPSGSKIEVTNLLDWARDHYYLFEPDGDPDAAAHRIAAGFGAIVSSMRGCPSRRRAVYQYKGWSLAGAPAERENRNDD